MNSGTGSIIVSAEDYIVLDNDGNALTDSNGDLVFLYEA